MSSERLEFRILGPLEVLRAGTPLRLGPLLQKTLLGALLVEPNQFVSVPVLFDRVWGDEPPVTANKSVQKYISGLRRVLGSERIERNGGGYRIVVLPGELDAESFIEDLSAARHGSAQERAEILERALGRWRGEPMADFPGAHFATVERTRLEQLRLEAYEDRLEAELELGRYATVLASLEALVDRHPFRERAWSLLMLALYRAGRQVDALRAYQSLRSTLGEELGIEPSVELKQLEEAILLQDPDLTFSAPDLDRRHNLPTQLTNFVGRTDELAEIDDLLSSVRLLSLIGPGGSGKTRLAIQAASGHVDEYRDGVWFVDLAPLTYPDQVPLAVARPLGVSGQPGRPTEVVLADYLADRELQLVLDNCEHLVDKVSELVATLLQAAAELRVLVTSREPIGVPGETTYEVRPLPFPEGDDDSNVAAFDAVRLFVDRARSADPHFDLTSTNARAVAQICRRLDGMPLALELAAARMRTFGPEQLTTLLDDRFTLLASPLRTGDARHRSLRAAVEWSYDLLSEPEQVLFRRLSVFRGGFELEAAEKVCGTDLLSRTDVLRLLPELVAKSLVVAIHRPDGLTRYQLLETLREYGHDRLNPTETQEVRDTHASYFCDLAEHAALCLRGPEQQRWFGRLAIDYDNLRRALSWAFARDVEMGIRLVIALADYWDALGPRVDAHAWLRRAVEGSDSATPDLRIKVRLAASDLFVSTHLSHSVRYAGEALQEARQIGNQVSEARALRALSWARGLQEVHEEAMSAGEQALQIFRELGDDWETAWCLERLGQADYQNPDRSIQRFQESLDLYRKVGDERRAAMVLYKMAERSAQSGGNLDTAAHWVEESVSIFKKMGSTHDRAHALLELGTIMRRRGRPEEARDMLDTALELLRKLGDQRCTGRALATLGIALTENGEHQRAFEALHESLGFEEVLEEKKYVRVSIAGLARLLASTDEKSKAATLYSVADKLGRELGLPVPEAVAARRRQFVEQLRAEIDPSEFKDAWSAGEAMSLTEAIALAVATPVR